MVETRKHGRSKPPHTARILAERESLQVRLAAFDRRRALREQGALAGDNTPTSDTLDTVQEAMAREEDLAVREAMIERLKVLVRAEEKIREGTYGMCETCGEAILCVPCAEAEEHRPLRSR